MHSFNECIAKSRHVEKSVDNVERSSEFVITKASEEQQIVFGWASVAIRKDGTVVEDLEQDTIEPNELEKSVYDYVLNFRDAGEKHDPHLRKKGKLVESVVFTDDKMQAMGIPAGTLPVGWWIGFKITDADAWDKIKKGEYRSFSIDGTGERVVEDSNPIAKSFNDIMANFHASKLSKNDNKLFTFSKKENIIEVGEARSFNECIEKFNPYHGRDGKFSSANSATSFTYRPDTAHGAAAIANETARQDTITAKVAANAVAEAKAAEPQMTSDLKELAGAVGGELVGLDFAVKGEESLTRKLISEQKLPGADGKYVDREKALSRMYDINRYTMQHEPAKLAEASRSVMDNLESKGYRVERIKNTFANEESPYRGMNTVVSTPGGKSLNFNSIRSKA